MPQSFNDYFQTTSFELVSGSMVVMWGLSALLLYLAAAHKVERRFFVPLAVGAVLANLPQFGLPAIRLSWLPPLIFLGLGIGTDFGPLIAAPRALLLGAAAQLGMFVTFVGAVVLGFDPGQAASIGVAGNGAGPAAIYTASQLAPDLAGPVAVAGYVFMSLSTRLQPPIMRALTTADERKIRMKHQRSVSQLERIAFAVLVAIVISLLVPSAATLILMLMLGNVLRETGVIDRLVDRTHGRVLYGMTMLLGLTVGLTLAGDQFLTRATLYIVLLGAVAFAVATACGVLTAKIMNLFTSDKLNPLIGSAGVSALPTAARVSHELGQKDDSQNHLLTHAMGPNVAGLIGTAVAAGYFISTLATR